MPPLGCAERRGPGGRYSAGWRSVPSKAGK
jgi:hypothetical protein